MHSIRLAVLTALLLLACAGSAAAAERFGISVSTTSPAGSQLTANKPAGTYDLVVSNGGDAASVTIQGPGVARVVWLPRAAFTELKGLRLDAGLYTVTVKAYASKATTQLAMPIGVAFTAVNGIVDGGTFSLIDPKFGVGTASLTVPAGWVQLTVSARSAVAADTPVHLEGPGATLDVVVPAGQQDSSRTLAFLPGPGQYAIGVPGGEARTLVVPDAATPQAAPPPLPADVTPPKLTIGTLACNLRGRVNRCGAPRVANTLRGTVTDPGAGASGVARVEVLVEAGSGVCMRPNGQSVSCAKAWFKASLRNGKWTANLPATAFAYLSGLKVTVRATDRAGNDAPVQPTRRYKPFG